MDDQAIKIEFKNTVKHLVHVRVYRNMQGDLDFVGVVVKAPDECICRSIQYCAQCEKSKSVVEQLIRTKLSISTEVAVAYR